MKVSLTLEDLEPIVVAEVLAVIHKHKAGKIPASEAAYLAAVKDASAASETAAPETAAPETDTSDDSGQAAVEQAGEPSEADLIIASLDEQFKRAKTATIMDGVQAKPEDEVITDTGETGVIMAVYRGRAVVEFEDGTAAEFKAAELKAAPQDDEPPAEQPEEKTEDEPKPSRRRRKQEEPEPEEEDEGELEGVALAKKLAEKISNDVLKDILKEFDAEALADLEDFSEEEVDEIIEVFKDEIEANA